MKRKMHGNGQGCVYKLPPIRRPDGRLVERRLPWAAVLTVGWSLEGKAIRRARCASSRKAADEMLADMLRARANGRQLPDDRLTVGKWLARWWETKPATIRRSTADNYERTIRMVLLPELGGYPLRTLPVSRVEAMLAGLRAAGQSPYTCARARDVLTVALDDAEREGLIERNVARLSHAPKRPALGKLAPTTEDVRALLAALADHRLHALFVLLAGTGLRISEACALRWEDVGGTFIGQEPSTRVLNVEYGLAWVDGEPVFDDPKTERSRRRVILPPVVADALRRHELRQGQERMAAGRRWEDASGLVFTTAQGGPLRTSSTIPSILTAACQRAGIRKIAAHDFRRYFATTVTDGVGEDVAQAGLGHRSKTMTDRYVTVTDEPLRKAAAVMEEALG